MTSLCRLIALILKFYYMSNGLIFLLLKKNVIFLPMLDNDFKLPVQNFKE